MRKAKNLGNRLMAMLLSAAMIFAPIFESVPVYAAEAGAETEGIGTLPEETVGQTGTVDADDTSVFSVMSAALFATGLEFSSVGGWNESIYAEIAGVKAANVTDVSWSGAMDGKLDADGLKYLVRDKGSNVRIDIPGLKAGKYTLTVTAGGNTYTESNIEVNAYDRSGFAHFKYTRGVGAYNDDGTLKDNAVVLYVTDSNKNEVTLTAGGVTVKGIGNILNSVGKDTGGGKTSNGGTPNTNQGVIQKLAAEGKPLVIRFVGTVSETGLGKKGTYTASDAGQIDGLTDYDSTGNGGSVGDNGHMARIQSGKDITLEGIGYDATIDGWGFHFISEGAYPNLGESFEVRNLIFINTPEDAVGMEGQQESANANSKLTSKVERCWIHNNEFYSPNISGPAESDKSEGDGSVDFKRGQYFTCSYNYFEGCHKTNLVGSADTSLQFNLSYHHNYWYLCKARGPLTRRANVHMYNNIFELQTDYAQNTRADAYIFSEYNLFYACKSPQAVESGAIKSYHDSISSVLQNKGTLGTVVTDKSTIVPNNCQFAAEKINYSKFDTDPEQSYIPVTNGYKLTEDFTELRKLITVQTGVMDKTPRKPEDVQEKEYSVIELLGDTPTQVVLSGNDTVNLDPSAEGYKGGKINKKGYAFSVNGDFNIKITYSSASKLKGVLVNAAGENLLSGSGEVVKLPAGTYMIQSEQFQPGDPKTLTPATFKETTIESIEITPFDPSKHYCNWVKDPSKSKAPNCTEAGEDVYNCTVEGCDQGGTKTEEVPALGHKYTQTGSTATCTAAGKTTYKCSVCDDTYDVDVEALGHNFVWKTDKAATATETGLKHEECTRCGTKRNENTEIPAGTAVVEPPVDPNPGDNQVTEGGEFELYFTNKRLNGDTDFFTVNAGGGYSDSKGKVTIGENEYKYSLKMASSTVAFSCNDGATLYLAFNPANAGLKVMVNSTEYTIGTDGTLKLENLSAGKYTIAKLKTDGEKNLIYVLVTNPEPEITYYNVSFDFNDDDGKEPIVLQIAENKSYAAMEALVPASFQKNGYTLKGLYKDADCSPEQAVQYPYVVTGNAILYADWEKDDKPVVRMYSIVFNTNGGSAVPDVRIAENQIYTITQRATKAGYAFAGWYDSAEGGNLVEMVDGSKLSGTYTVYAHWNATEKVSELDCSSLTKDISDANGEVNFTENTTINGFTIHALPGGIVGTDGKENPKYYMTAKKKDGMLYTNGVLIKADDPKSPAEGNEAGVLKSIEFTTEGSGYLAVDVQLSGTSAANGNYYLVLAHKDENGNLVEDGRQVIVSGSDKVDADKTRAVREFDVPGANTYYLYALGDKGVAYANIKFIEQVYTVLYQVGTGTVPEGQESVTAREGEQVQLPVCTANPGYTFKGWSMDGGKTMLDGSYTVKEDDATDGLVTITACYELISYTVNFDANGGTLPEGMTATRSATVEDTLTLGDCVPGEEGQLFLGWTVNDSSNTITRSYKVNPADAVEDADGKKVINLKAVYTEAGKVYYTVKFDAGDGTLPGTMEASCLKEAEAVVELGACTPPTAAQKFIGWSVDGTEKKVTSSYTVNPEDAKEVDGQKVITLKAVYTEEGKTYYTVKFSAESGSLPEGMNAEVTAEADDLLTLGECVPPTDKRFVGWSVNGSKETITSEYKVKAEDADENGVIAIKAVYGVKNTGIAIIGLEPSYPYTGAKIIPNIGVVDYDVDDGRILAPGVDYSVQYKNNSKAGETATVTVTGKGNYAGKDITQTFKIEEVTNVVGEPADLKGAKLGKIDALTYNGSAQYPNLTLTLKGGVAVEYTYDGTARVYKAADGTTIPANVTFSNNTNKGTATVLLTGANDNKNKPTKIKKTFKINAVDISKATVVVEAQPGTYGVKGASPASITVTCNGVKLKNGTDYTVKYSANKKVTTEAKITITGKGNYTKKYTSKTYTINQLNLSETGENTKVGIKAVTAYTGVAAGKVKATVTDKDGNALKASQYTLKVYKDAKGESEYESRDKLEAGMIYVQAIAKDTVNLTGETAIVGFDVAENIAKVKTELRKDGRKVMTKEYTGQAITLDKADLTVSIKVKGETQYLERGKDYEIVSYSNNINKGTATAVIKGIGSYSGTKTVKFKIVGKTMKIENNKTTWDDVSSLIKGIFDR